MKIVTLIFDKRGISPPVKRHLASQKLSSINVASQLVNMQTASTTYNESTLARLVFFLHAKFTGVVA